MQIDRIDPEAINCVFLGHTHESSLQPIDPKCLKVDTAMYRDEVI